MSLPLEKARAAAKGKLVETAGGTLHVRVTGDGPDVLLIHGVTDNGATWDRLAPTLATRARVHAIDLPGHGLSSIPDHPLTVVEMARAMSAYLDAAKIERCVVAGNSLGGGVTVALAHAEPNRVTAIAPLGSIGTPFTTVPPVIPTTTRGVVDIFGIVASTGGPPALAAILRALPAELPVPILVAQHMSAGFTSGLVRWLGELSSLAIEIGSPGVMPLPGRVYFPPDGQDLEVDAEGLLCVRASRSLHVPSGDALLTSLARAYRERAGGLVLTGMGEDGARGLLAIEEAGGLTAAQDDATCVVYGMPKAAAALGAARAILPLELIAPFIRERCQRGTP